jgi:hypothetical protein
MTELGWDGLGNITITITKPGRRPKRKSSGKIFLFENITVFFIERFRAWIKKLFYFGAQRPIYLRYLQDLDSK